MANNGITMTELNPGNQSLNSIHDSVKRITKFQITRTADAEGRLISLGPVGAAAFAHHEPWCEQQTASGQSRLDEPFAHGLESNNRDVTAKG